MSPPAPLVSVVIPCYNSAHFVADAVEGVLAQEGAQVEILVVDDGSDDAVALDRALSPFGDAVTLLRPGRGGLAQARNHGLAAARGSYVAFLDADDVWKPGFLDRQLRLLEETGADLVYCDAEHFGPRAEPGVTVMSEFPSRGEPTLEAILTKQCLVVMSTVVARTAAVRKAGGFDATRKFGEDLDVWVRMLVSGARFAYHGEALARRRIHGDNMSRNAVGMVEGSLEIVRRHAGEPRFDWAARRRIRRHLRALTGEFHLERAKRRLAERDAEGARGDLWKAARLLWNPKALVGAVVLTVRPTMGVRLLADRYAADLGLPGASER